MEGEGSSDSEWETWYEVDESEAPSADSPGEDFVDQDNKHSEDNGSDTECRDDEQIESSTVPINSRTCQADSQKSGTSTPFDSGFKCENWSQIDDNYKWKAENGKKLEFEVDPSTVPPNELDYTRDDTQQPGPSSRKEFEDEDLQSEDNCKDNGWDSENDYDFDSMSEEDDESDMDFDITLDKPTSVVESAHISSYRKFKCQMSGCGFETTNPMTFNIHRETVHECPYCGQVYVDITSHKCPHHGNYHRQVGIGRIDETTFKELDEDTFHEVEVHHRRAMVTYEHVPQKKYESLDAMFTDLRGALIRFLHQQLDLQIVIKAQFKVKVDLEDIKTGDILPNIWLITSLTPLNHPDFINRFLKFMEMYIKNTLAIYNQNGSGLKLREILLFQIVVAENENKVGGRGLEVPLPKELKNKRGLLYIHSTDNLCFHYCVAAGIYEEQARREVRNRYKLSNNKKSPSLRVINKEMRKKEVYEGFLKYFNFEGIRVPVPLTDIGIFSSNNNISVNVYGMRDKELYAIERTREEKIKHIDLLYLEGEGTIGHFLLIKDISSLLGHDGKKRHDFCKFCGSGFKTSISLKKHESICTNNTNRKVRFPKADHFYFKNMYETLRFPYVIYYDFETFSSPMQEKACPSTTSTGKIEPAQYSLILLGPDDFLRHKIYDGPDPVGDFLITVDQMADEVRSKLQLFKKRNPLTAEEQLEFDTAEACMLCGNEFTKKNFKLRHHCHATGKNIGPTCNVCNLRAKTQNVVPILAHGGRNFDHHLILKGLKSNDKVKLMPKSGQKFLGFELNRKLKFLDSCQFMPGALRAHAKSLLKDGEKKFHLFFQFFKNIQFGEDFYKPEPYTDDEIRLLLGKQAFPYSIMKDESAWGLRELPSIEAFNNTLNYTEITPKRYEHALKVWNTFQCHRFVDYSRLYCLVDTLILACIVEAQRKAAFAAYGLEMLHKWSCAGFSYSAGMFTSGASLEYIKDESMLQMIKSGIRGGPCVCNTRLFTANNERIGNFDPTKPRTHILYADLNSLYPYCLLNSVPTHGFKWVTEEELDSLDIANMGEDSGIGYFIECDLEYDPILHDSHQDLPLAPEKLKIGIDDLSEDQYNIMKERSDGKEPSVGNIEKLVLSVRDKNNYVCYYKTLKFYLKHGLRIKGKIKRAIKFFESPVFHDYIGGSLAKRAEALSLVMKLAYKLAANSFYGKFLHCSANFNDIVICTTRAQALKLISHPEIVDFYSIDENLSIFTMKRKNPVHDSLLFVAFTVLDLAKLRLMQVHYEGVKSVFQNRCRIAYTDTDSAIYLIDDPENTYIEDLKSLSWLFDYSKNVGAELHNDENKDKPGMFKVEAIDIKEFCGLSAKMYSYTKTGEEDGAKVEVGEKKAKGVSRAFVDHKITHEDYVRIVKDNTTVMHADMNIIRSTNQQLYNQILRKVALSALDMKRYLLPDGIHTLPFGHKRIKEIYGVPEDNSQFA